MPIAPRPPQAPVSDDNGVDASQGSGHAASSPASDDISDTPSRTVPVHQAMRRKLMADPRPRESSARRRLSEFMKRASLFASRVAVFSFLAFLPGSILWQSRDGVLPIDRTIDVRITDVTQMRWGGR
jgi:hypothetical protein